MDIFSEVIKKTNYRAENNDVTIYMLGQSDEQNQTLPVVSKPRIDELYLKNYQKHFENWLKQYWWKLAGALASRSYSVLIQPSYPWFPPLGIPLDELLCFLVLCQKPEEASFQRENVVQAHSFGDLHPWVAGPTAFGFMARHQTTS